MPRILPGAAFGAVVCAALGLVDGCVDRPVAANSPITKTNFIASIPTGSIDKVDLLFDIDNSASMGDKQAYLARAIPDLITRLVQPNCVKADAMGMPTIITGSASLEGACIDPDSTPEFPPVHNLHIGIISSSLGQRLGDQCLPEATQPLKGGGTISRHNDDQAHLLDRGGNPADLSDYTESPVADADPDHFLNWFPPPTVNPANTNVTPTGPMPVTDPTVLNADFQKLVIGVHQFGCGVESQLETWYRFLIQPDPYASLVKDASGRAQWSGFDTTILAQRADFLRPDSLVAILVLSDENDSEVDVRSFSGTAWNFMVGQQSLPRGTSACTTSGPNDPACTSCAPGFGAPANDPECAKGDYTAQTDWGENLNLRHVHEKQKYGVSVQYPIQRYVTGLTSTTVPDRNGEYPSGAQSYQGLVPGNQKCVNPLFAATLPTPPSGTTAANWKPNASDLCNLTPGTRKPDLVFYAHIGGVPHELLQVDPSKTDTGSQSQKATLTDADWERILGKDPENFDYTGIDPHMVESYQPRTGVAKPSSGFPVFDPSQPEGKDPISSREWITDSTSPLHAGALVDLEYACTFKLTDATGAPAPRDCSASTDATMGGDPTLAETCDCLPPASGMLTHAEVPGVCNDAKPTQQDYAKVYPTIRELDVARLLGQVHGANKGIISSLCPIHTTDTSSDGKSDPLYGYRPAMNAIIAELSKTLAHQCLPERLEVTGGDAGTEPPQVPCLVLGTFTDAEHQPKNCDDPVLGGAYTNPEPEILAHFHQDQENAFKQGGEKGTDQSTLLTCQLQQLTPNVDCSKGAGANDAGDSSSKSGWCYVGNGSIQGCPQAILFSPSVLAIPGVTTTLQCLEASSGEDAAVATPGT